MKKPSPRRRNPLLVPLIAMCALVVVLAAAYIIKYYSDEHKTEALNRQLLALLHTPAPTETPPEPTATPMPKESEPNEDTIVMHLETPPAEIDGAFADLYALNPDLVGRLRVPCGNSPIDLFVVQRDNTYYLTHDFYGTPSKAGTLFLDQSNVLWPQDQHMIIYGHNMKNGSMFARLSRYASFEFTSFNPFVYFDTLYEKNTYVIVCSLRITAEEAQSDSFNLRSFIFGEASFNAFVYQLMDRALVVTDAGVNSDDQLLTLCTCSYSEDDERFLLVTRRLREGETEEALATQFKNTFTGKE